MASTEIVSSVAQAGGGEGRARWRRVGAMFGASVVGWLVLAVLTAQGVIAAQFAISGLPFTVTATRLTGTGFEQFGALDNTAPGSPNQTDTGGQVLVVTSAIQSAELANLCQSVNLGGTNLKITAGGGSTPVRATTLVVDSDLLTGDVSFSNTTIGQDASTVDRVPGVVGSVGNFAQQAQSVTINNLRQNNFATTAATFTLPGLRLSFDPNAC